LRRYVGALEVVQRSFTRFIPEMRDLPDEQRLDIFYLYSLEIGSARGDLIKL